MRPVTSHDVARLAGVSQPTVSRALRDDPRVSAETRERVRRAATELSYVTSRRGRSLRTRETGQVAVVVDDLANPFYQEAIDHLHVALERAGLRMVVMTAGSRDAPAVRQVRDESIDGVVLTTTLLGSPAPRDLAGAGLPLVLLNRTVDGREHDTCVSENAGGAEELARVLAYLGHTKVAAIMGPAETSTGRDRDRGFRAGLAAAGLALPDALVRRGPFAFATGHEALADLMGAERQPTAVFCANDVVAIGALNAARRLGARVPDDLTIVGFDDIAMAAWEVFQLSTIRQDLAAMARAAVELLVARIEDRERDPRHVCVPTELVLRGSHAAPASGASRNV